LGLSRDCELTDVEVHEGKRPLRLSKVHTLLMREYGLEASYDTLLR
jgi:hypothetical protein